MELYYDPHLVPTPNKVAIALRGAEGPDALQIVIKASMVVPELEGCGPSQPWKQ